MSVGSYQRSTALLNSRDERFKAAYFRPAAGGFVYRAPNPWIYGRPHHYLVSTAQREGIVAILAPRSQSWARLALSVILAAALIAAMS